MKQEEVLIRDLGLFNKEDVLNILRDKINLDQQNIQLNKEEGIETLLQKLNDYQEYEVKQFSLTTPINGYQIISSIKENELLGIVSNSKRNIQERVDYQKNLTDLGYPIRDLALFEKGLFKKKV